MTDHAGQETLKQELAASVTELYAAFRGRKLSPDGPDACTYCCASPEAMARIARSAPEAITLADLREYHSAAKGDGAGQDLVFLLPRSLEFVALGYEVHTAGMFALFGRYFVPMWDVLSARERAALRHFCATLMRWRLAAHGTDHCEYAPLEILEMVTAGGIDVDPVLDALADPPDRDGTVEVLIHLVLYHAGYWQDGSGLFDDDATGAAYVAERLRAIIAAPHMLQRLERAALAEGDADRAACASLAHQIAENLTHG